MFLVQLNIYGWLFIFKATICIRTRSNLCNFNMRTNLKTKKDHSLMFNKNELNSIVKKITKTMTRKGKFSVLLSKWRGFYADFFSGYVPVSAVPSICCEGCCTCKVCFTKLGGAVNFIRWFFRCVQNCFGGRNLLRQTQSQS